MRTPEEVVELPVAEWVSVSVRCPVTSREVAVPLADLVLEAGGAYGNWLTYPCPACGQEHRSGGQTLSMGR